MPAESILQCDGVYNLDGGFLSLVQGCYPLIIMCRWWQMSCSGRETRADQGNQHNNGPHQDQIFDNPSSLCLTLWLNPPKICSSWGRADAPSRLFTKGVGLSLHFFVFFHRPIYSVYGLPFTVRHNATTITLPSFLFFFPFPTLRPQANYSGAVSVLS